MKIIVLAGGLSTERDVSLVSAAGICRTLLEKGHDAFLLDVFMGLENPPEHLEDVFTLPGHGLEIAGNIGTSEPDLAAVKASRPDQSDCFLGPNVIELCRMADITFLGLHGGEGENGKLQATFDLLGIRYTGPDSLGCAVAMDKGFTKEIFLQAGIDTPKGAALYKSAADRSLSSLGLTLPAVVKPCSGGSSIGVRRVLDRADVLPAVEEAFKYEDDILIESFVNGREVTCGVLGDTALPPAEVIPQGGFYDYAHKYQSGLITEICPAELPVEVTAEVQDISLRVFRALGLEVYARMDFIYDGRDFYCLEANTLPGMTPTSHLPQEAKAMGISYPELCMRIIELSLEKYNK